MESSGVKKQSTETRKHYTADYGWVGGGAERSCLGVGFFFFPFEICKRDKIHSVSTTGKEGGDDTQAQSLRGQQITRCILFLFLTCWCSFSCLLICFHSICYEEEQITTIVHTRSWKRPAFMLYNLIRPLINISKFLWRNSGPSQRSHSGVVQSIMKRKYESNYSEREICERSRLN